MFSLGCIDFESPADFILRLRQFSKLLFPVFLRVKSLQIRKGFPWRIPVSPIGFNGVPADIVIDILFGHIPEDDVFIFDFHNSNSTLYSLSIIRQDVLFSLQRARFFLFSAMSSSISTESKSRFSITSAFSIMLPEFLRI